MIVACHQPNFLPYPGYFYKMRKADIFTFSDTVKMSRHAFFNYNYIMVNGEKKKITVPVHGSSTMMLKDVKLCDWFVNGKKIFKTISQAYSKAPYADRYMPELAKIFESYYLYAVDLNVDLIRFLAKCEGISTPTCFERYILCDSTEPNSDIVDICKKLRAKTYLCGKGAGEYFDEQFFSDNGIKVVYSNYVPDQQMLSSVHYLLENGRIL